jgi:glycosyltransferase involved in cell wall biosynthesis
MNIGISTSVVQRGQTGIGQYVLALLRAFARIDTPHKFFLFVLKQDLPLFAEFRERMRIVPVSECFRSPVLNILWHQTLLPRLARKNKLDLLHVPSYRRLLHPQPCALVSTIHDLAPFHVTAKYDPLRMFYGRVVVRRLARQQHSIIAISRNTARDIFRFFDVPRDRVRVIYNGLDHNRFTPHARETLRAQAQKRWQFQQPFFLYVSRLEHPAKNHVRLISAFDQFKQATNSPWQLVFAGKDWSGAESIHQMIQSSPFQQDIRSLGFVPDADLPALYHAADACVYPSLYEGFGMPPVEAMACGCSVLCSDRGALAEVIGDAALIVDPEDVPDLARKLRAMAGDPDLRRRLKERGLRQARRFDWQETALATLDLYERTVFLNSGRRPTLLTPELRRRLPPRNSPAKQPVAPSMQRQA